MTVVAEPSPLPPEHALAIDQALGPYKIGPGDVLTITMTGLDQPTTSTIVRARVDKTGKIDVPLAGGVMVADLEVTDAERQIKAAYVPNIVRQMAVTVDVDVYEQTGVVVTGAALNPGLVPLRRTERNLLYAVLSAGGISEAASGQVTLRRIRRPHEVECYVLTDPLDLERALSADALENGDIIVVEPALPNTIYVGGLVTRPSPQTFPAGVRMNILQVLASAGGLRPDVFPTEGTLIRRMPDGEDVQVKLNLDRIQRGLDDNITLAAGDILWVPDTAGTRLIDFFNRNFFFRGGVSINYNATATEFMNSNARATQLNAANAGLQSQFDPFGFLLQNQALGNLTARP